MSSLRALLVAGLVAVARAMPAPAPVAQLQQQQQQPSPQRAMTPKYFNEPGGSVERGHYDLRFFHSELGYLEHQDILRDLIRSYLSAMGGLGVETWLAHGTLLGWWWNGRIMPWDYDLDVQVSTDTLQLLADNRTEHAYRSSAGGATKRYLLDVSPHHADLHRGDGANIIDARWVDMDNGMFIDITGLRQRDPSAPGLWSCKNMHRYASHDLWPMRMSQFEGVPARIPYNFEKMLSVEYGPKSLVVEEHLGHRWDRQSKQWLKMTPSEELRRSNDMGERKKHP